MRSKEHNPMMNAGPHNVCKTTGDWVQLIDELENPAMVMTVAEALAGADLIKEYEKDSREIKVYMTREQIIELALEKYMRLSGGQVVALLEKIRDVVELEKRNNPSNSRDLFELKLGAIDMILKKRNRAYLLDLYLYLNSRRDFLPMELLKIQVAKIHRLMQDFDKPEEIRGNSLESVSGVIGETK